MSDSVQRLRLSACGDCQRALAEIERLQAENQELRAAISSIATWSMRGDPVTLYANAILKKLTRADDAR
jgi:hypothetical protein